MQHYDIIIAGGGCAGLSLAYQLIHSPLRDRSILIIDRDDKDQNDRTWAFWTDRPTPFQPVVHREWRQLRFLTEAGECSIATDPWCYVMIRGDDWYRHIRGLLAARPNVTWLKAPVKRIEDQADGALVFVDPDGHGPAPAMPYHGTWVFDSLFNINTFKPDTRSTLYLQQHFKGWYIETPDDRFDEDAATIFDFRTPQADDRGVSEMRFFYLLPTSPRTALVEYVGLRLADFDVLLDGYIRKVLHVDEYKVVSDEIGITPMTDYPFPRQVGQHVMAVGIQGGLAKATTGYAYTRIQNDSAAIVASLMDCGHPFAVPAVNRPGYRLLDSVMLEVMRRNPAALKPTFEAMFSGNAGPRIFRFLDERASFGEIVRLVLTLPKLPFLIGGAEFAVSRTRARLTRRPTAPAARLAPPSLDASH
jgi:lycopene beta-cyclase